MGFPKFHYKPAELTQQCFFVISLQDRDRTLLVWQLELWSEGAEGLSI